MATSSQSDGISGAVWRPPWILLVQRNVSDWLGVGGAVGGRQPEIPARLGDWDGNAFSFREIQKIYTVSGALFFPLLALVLLIFNGKPTWVGREFRNRPATVAALVGILAFFSWMAVES